MSNIKLNVAEEKGEAILRYSDDVYELVMFVFHANSLVPLKNTLHLSLKPGHSILYVKRRGEESGKWILADPGYVNYFRPEWEDIDGGVLNTMSKQKLVSRGKLSVDATDEKIVFKSKTYLPYHVREVTFDTNELSFQFDDNFFGKATISWNGENDLENKSTWWSNSDSITL